MLRSRYPFADVSLAEQYDRAREHQAASDPGEDLCEYSDYGDVPGDLDDDPGDDTGRWNATYAVHEAVERIEAGYRELARPMLAQQARNPGVRLAALVQLEQECAEKIDAIMKSHQRAAALELAARRQPQQVATAHERQLEQAASRAFARDLGRVRRLPAEPEPAGRDVRSTWSW